MIRRSAITSALALVLATAVSAQTPRTSTEKSGALAALQGTWLTTIADGQDMAGSGQEIFITITDNKYVQTVNGQVAERGTFKLDETKKPIAVDLTIVEGNDAGQMQLGVLELDGKTMHGKFAQPGSTVRPTDFAVAEGFFTFTMVKK